MSDSNLAGKVVVITGASTGIGAVFAKIVAARGAKVVLAARREGELNEVAQACGADALAVVTDVTKRAEVDRLAEAAIARFGRIDAWVNNAGRGISRMPSQLTDEDLDEMILVNVKSALYGMQAALPHFKAQGTGHVVNVSSMLGRIAFAPVRSAYSAAKAAMNSLTQSFRLEHRDAFPGITFSAVYPGPTATEFGVNSLHGGLDSRKIPGVQPVDEVALVMADLLEHPRAEAYTRPAYREQAAAFHSAPDVAAFEASSPMFATRPPPKAP